MAKLPVNLDQQVLERLINGNLPVLEVKQGNLKYLTKSSLKILIGVQSSEIRSGSGHSEHAQEDAELIAKIPGLDSVSDLEPSKYEGGFKVWESTKDLLEYLYQNPDLVRGKTVLDVS